MSKKRISKTEYYLKVAEVIALRSTCLRRMYGSVIVRNDQILSCGFNGSPRNTANCCDLGYCYKKQNNIPHGTDYVLNCTAVHSEMNAIVNASRTEMTGSVLYLSGINYDDGKLIMDVEPCGICMRMIINAGIIGVYSWKNLEKEAFNERYNYIDVAARVNEMRLSMLKQGEE